MYILKYKNQVIAGPRDWNAAMFNYALESVGVSASVPGTVPDQMPFVINSDAKICQCDLAYPQYNNKIEYAHGPFWDFSQDVAVGTFEVKQKSIESIKNELKSIVAAERYKNEISGTKTTIQNLEITIDTTRGVRDIFAQKYLLMSDSEVVNWKFPEGWLTLTKTQLGDIVNVAVAHIQNEFNWEKSKVEEIESASTAAELDSIVLSK